MDAADEQSGEEHDRREQVREDRVGAALRDDDVITSTHRGHGHLIAKGADVGRMMAELLGRVDGLNRGRGGSMHIADLALGIYGANGIVVTPSKLTSPSDRRPSRTSSPTV